MKIREKDKDTLLSIGIVLMALSFTFGFIIGTWVSPEKIRTVTNRVTKIVETDNGLAQQAEDSNWLKRIELGQLIPCEWNDRDEDCKFEHREKKWYEKDD